MSGTNINVFSCSQTFHEINNLIIKKLIHSIATVQENIYITLLQIFTSCNIFFSDFYFLINTFIRQENILSLSVI